jgi:sugar (pentulose or hexulose) kinase
MIAWCIQSPITPTLFNIGGPVTTGGAALDWLLYSVLGSTADYETALASAALIPAGAEGLVFFPYLAGEPLTYGSGMRAAFVGLSLQHGTAHLVRAVLEGVALAGRSIMECLLQAGGQVHEVWTYGGQAGSALWNQIKANVWKRPVCTPKVPHAGCLGAAAIASVGTGAQLSLEVASERMVQEGQRYEPERDSLSVYDESYRVFVGVCPHMGHLLQEQGLPFEEIGA